jgi:hypothetical protein
VLVADITDEFIRGLDSLRAYDASMDAGRHVLRLGSEEVPVREAPTASVLTRPRLTESRGSGRTACWQREDRSSQERLSVLNKTSQYVAELNTEMC